MFMGSANNVTITLRISTTYWTADVLCIVISSDIDTSRYITYTYKLDLLVIETMKQHCVLNSYVNFTHFFLTPTCFGAFIAPSSGTFNVLS
jgi:hypothetical protein